MEELFSSTLFLPLRPRWWGGRTFIEERTVSFSGSFSMRIPRSHTSCGAFIEADIVSYLVLYSGLLPRCSCGGGAFIEECTVTFLGRNFPNISLNPVTG